MAITFKETTLGILLALSALSAGFAWDKILDQPYWAACIFVFTICLGLYILLVKNIYAKWIGPALSLVLFSVFFKMDLFLFAGAACGVIFTAYGVRLAFEDENASFKIFIKRRLGPSLKVFFTGLSVLLAFVYFGAIENNPKPEQLLLPESVFNVTLKLMEPSIRQAIPNFRAEATMSEVFTPLEREAYAIQFGVHLKGSEKIAEVMYAYVLGRVRDYTGDYAAFVPVIAAISYFVALKTVSLLVYHISLILIFVIVKILIMAGGIKKVEVATVKEIYT